MDNKQFMKQRFNEWDYMLNTLTQEDSLLMKNRFNIQSSNQVEKLISIIEKQYQAKSNECGIGMGIISVLCALKYDYPQYYQKFYKVYQKQKDLWM